jgi:hypothetical protein
MGAHNFSDTIMIKGNQSDAYNSLHEDALHEYGHDSYNGTISTTNRYRDLTSEAPRYGTKAFEKFEDKVLENNQYGIEKWGNCACIEISKNTALFKKMKARSRFKGKKGVRYFYFFGWAAS